MEQLAGELLEDYGISISTTQLERLNGKLQRQFLNDTRREDIPLEAAQLLHDVLRLEAVLFFDQVSKSEDKSSVTISAITEGDTRTEFAREGTGKIWDYTLQEVEKEKNDLYRKIVLRWRKLPW
ncbi:MAG: hypothetical protein Q4Q07_10350 [Tissierellia bacterium]|nr:hypothetical protein [Tissierellia bacterium]